MSDVTITGLTLRNSDPWESGSRLIAFFDAEVPFFRLHGCRLVLQPNGHVTVHPPHINGPRGDLRSIRITDAELKNEMRAAAIKAYRALGGVLSDHHDTEDADPE